MEINVDKDDKEKNRKRRRRIGRRVAIIVSSSFAVLIAFSLIMSVIVLEPTFKISGFGRYNSENMVSASYTVRILDNDDKQVSGLLYGDNKVFTPIDQVPQHTIDAFISIEDKRFYSHKGVDYKRIFGAAKNNIASGSKKEGASTITQQLVKNTHLSNEKTYKRKLNEIRIARQIERKYSKEQILENYLNILYFGNGIYGIGTASKTFFGVEVSELNLEQSALLAGIINSPLNYSPYHNLEKATARRNLILIEMYKDNKITAEELDAAKLTEIRVMSDIHSKNPYFSTVLADASRVLNKSQRQLFKQNLTIATYLDDDLDTKANGILNNHLTTLPKSDELLAKVITLCNNSGEVIAIATHGNTNFTNLRRQAGSTLKPIICYAPLLEQRKIIPRTPILDERTSFGGYSPANYRNSYDGWTSVDNALANSSNAVAVKLLNIGGVANAKNFAQKLNINFSPSDNSLALALGATSRGLTLKQIANCYQAFANDGKIIKACSIRYIKDSNGNVIYRKKTLERQVMSDITAYFINSMLKNCADNGTAKFLSNNNLKYIAGKTGTVGNQNGNTDAYCIAYTKNYTVAVWVGSKDNNTPHQIGGGGTPTIIARDTMLALYRNTKNISDFNRPKNITQIDIDLTEYNNRHRLIQACQSLAPRFKKTIEIPKGLHLS